MGQLESGAVTHSPGSPGLVACTCPWPGKAPAVPATCCPLGEGTCFAAHLELIFALEVVQEVLVVGVTHLAEQREKAGHVLTLGRPERHLAQTITRATPTHRGKDSREGLRWPHDHEREGDNSGPENELSSPLSGWRTGAVGDFCSGAGSSLNL